MADMTLPNQGEGDLRVAQTLLTMPLASAEDIAAVQDRTVSGVYSRLRNLADAGWVKSVALGCSRRRVARYYLTEDGQAFLNCSGATWHQAGTLCRLLERMPSVEWLYPAAASIREFGQLRSFQWVDDVSFDAAVRYQRGWAALFWLGLLRSERGISDRLERFGNDLQDLADTDSSPLPSILCFVVEDRWQVELLRRVVGRFIVEDWVKIWCIADNSWYSTDYPLSSRGWVNQPVYLRRTTPGVWSRHVGTSLWSTEYGQDAARILHAVAEWPGMTIRLAKLVLGEGDSGRRAQKCCARLTELGLLERWQEKTRYRYRLSSRGMTLLANMDRTTSNGAWQQIKMDRWKNLDGFEVHEYGLLDVVEPFIAAGLPVASGWRDWEYLGSEGGIAPDALVFLQSDSYLPSWHYLEYERSARSPAPIARKLRGYDSPLRSNRWPVLVVCLNDLAEANFHRVGSRMRISMLTTTIERLSKHGPVGNPRCWSMYGRPRTIG